MQCILRLSPAHLLNVHICEMIALGHTVDGHERFQFNGALCNVQCAHLTVSLEHTYTDSQLIHAELHLDARHSAKMDNTNTHRTRIESAQHHSSQFEISHRRRCCLCLVFVFQSDARAHVCNRFCNETIVADCIRGVYRMKWASAHAQYNQYMLVWCFRINLHATRRGGADIYMRSTIGRTNERQREPRNPTWFDTGLLNVGGACTRNVKIASLSLSLLYLLGMRTPRDELYRRRGRIICA